MRDAKKVLAEAFELEPAAIPNDASLAGFDPWDSLAHVRVIMSVEEALGRSLDTHEVVDVIDIASVQRLLDAG